MTSEETLLKEIKELKECLSRLEEYLLMSCQIQQNMLKLYDLLQSDIDDLKPCNNIEQEISKRFRLGVPKFKLKGE